MRYSSEPTKHKILRKESKRNTIISGIMQEKSTVKHPIQPGPRSIFLHLIYDEKKELEEAMDVISQRFPAISRNNMQNWYEEAEKKRQTERGANDDAR